MIRRWLFLSLLLLAGLAPAAAADIKPLDIGKGTEVWFTEDHTVPIVSVVFSFPAGSAYDPVAKAGLASFTAAMIDEGAGGLSSSAFHGALADRAIQFRAVVERDHMVITITTLTENLPEAMHLLQLALTHPRFDADAVARVRTQMIQSIQQNETQPPQVAQKNFMRAFFNGHAYAHAPEGEIASLSTITAEDMRNFVRTHWVKAGLDIAMAGDITPAAATKLLADTFKPVSGAPPPALPLIGKLGSPGVHVTPMAVPQPTILFGLPGIMRSDPQFMAGYLANYIVGGGGFSSRLTDEVRVKRGLTYGITTDLSPLHRASIMVGSVATRADAVRQTIQVVHDTLANFAQNGATQAELDDAKTYLTGSFPIAFSSNAGTAAQLGVFQRQGLDIGYMARRNGLVQAVTLDDVRKAAKRIFDPARLTVVVAGTPVEGRPVTPVAKVPVRPTPPPVVAPPSAVNTASAPAAKPVAKPAVKAAIKPRN